MTAQDSRSAALHPSAPREAGRPSQAEIDRSFRDVGYDLARHPAHVIRRAHQRATTHFQQVMAGEDVTPTQFAALAKLLEHGELSQNHLGRLTAMDPSTISLVIRKLRKQGLVTTRPSETDQRLAMNTLTDEGVRFTLDRLGHSVEVGRRLLAPLTAAEAALLVELLERVAGDPESTD